VRWKQEEWVTHVRKLAEKFEWKAGDLFMLVRLIMCGSPFSPPLFESMQILGKKEVLCRLQKFVGKSNKE
jgi:glutamyl/glutaminyl-tRNA synthetase